MNHLNNLYTNALKLEKLMNEIYERAAKKRLEKVA
nr:MAG TPA: hypothetical protein [Caudoviricetes sp.]